MKNWFKKKNSHNREKCVFTYTIVKPGLKKKNRFHVLNLQGGVHDIFGNVYHLISSARPRSCET